MSSSYNSTTVDLYAGERTKFSIVAGFMIGVLAVAVVVFARRRYAVERQVLQRIPRSYMPIRPRDIGYTGSASIADGVIESVSTGRDVRPRTAKVFSQRGWGAPGSDFEGVHFRTAIEVSVVELEKRAGPVLERDASWTIAEYLGELRKLRPGLNEVLCTNYLTYFDAARYGAREFTEDEFLLFHKIFARLLAQFAPEDEIVLPMSRPLGVVF